MRKTKPILNTEIHHWKIRSLSKTIVTCRLFVFWSGLVEITWLTC